jgi:hypothetical protein
MFQAETSRRENLIFTGIFFLALIYHVYGITLNWTAGFLSGHEFRQAQTAITSYYIDQQDNFSLLYETPILGKPWVSILMEVPLYEWSVVLLSRATGLPHYMAARTVSAACFYLMLPALYLLLGRGGVRRPHRLLTLALVLTCPVYIFYSRAFLMESMELLCCAWFLLGFVRMMDRRRWYWFLFTAAAGTGAALIKGTTLAVWLLPAAGFGAHVLWRDLRARSGWRAPSETVFWGLAGVAVPLGALRLWIELTDPLKSVHASAWIFTSKNLSQGNWGLADVAARFSAGTWGVLAGRHAPVAAALGLGGGVAPAAADARTGAGPCLRVFPGAADVPLCVCLSGLLFLRLCGIPAGGVWLPAAGRARFPPAALGQLGAAGGAFWGATPHLRAWLLPAAGGGFRRWFFLYRGFAGFGAAGIRDHRRRGRLGGHDTLLCPAQGAHDQEWPGK